MDDPRPVVRCITAWWPVKTATPVIRPRGLDHFVGPTLVRTVEHGAMTLEDAATHAALGFEVIVDPFDMDELTRWEQRNRPAKKWLRNRE